MSASSSSASGLALSIRNAEESETFDLGGQNVSTITNTIHAAFAKPLPLKDKMIRITFVTGAGKQARQKYDEGAARAVTSTLRDLGYEEDRAASCVVECAGTFKLQHDTGKNLKTVVVFPKIVGGSINGSGDGTNNANRDESKPSLVPEGCPAYKIAMSSVSTFERLLQSQCPSWSQKKGCSAALEHLKHMVDEIDTKLMQGTPMEEAEQEFYNSVTGLDDKLALVKDEMHKQVERGDVTKFEKELLLEHNAERLESIADEIKQAKGQTPKKVEKLKAMQDKAMQRKELLQTIEPRPPHKLRHEQAIARLWKEAVPLLQLEEKTKGRLLSVKETQEMARKEAIMEEIKELEEASRGWFEDDDAFDARVKAIRENFTAKLNQKSKANRGSGGAVSITSNTTTSVRKDKWVTPGESKKNAWNSAASNKKKQKAKGSDVFAAMMAKSGDSDDDDDEEHDDEADNGNDSDDSYNDEKQVSTATPDKTAKDNNTTSSQQEVYGDKKGGKKKNKKNKGKKKQEADMSEDELLASSAAANKAAAKAEAEKQVSHPAIDFLRSYVVPFILGFITWVVSLFMGKPKQKKR